MDPGGNVSSWNAGAERLKGWTEDEIVGRHFSVFYPPEDVGRGKPARDLAAAVSEGVYRDEGWRLRKGGERFWAETVITAMRDESGELLGFAKVTRDRTEQKKAEDALGRQQELLTEANKSLDAFVSAVAHDLRAPIRHVLGFARLLADDYGGRLDDEGRRRLAKIEDGAQSMGRLVDDLLNLARLGRQALSPQPVPLGTLVRETIEELAREAEGRSVEWRVGELFAAPCDPGLVRLVFVNLLSNALKYSRPRERAVIEIGSLVTEAGEPAVFVRDNGVGFDMRFSGKLFGVFSRLHSEREFEGTGVGLATVHRIVRKHGGRIWAEAEVGKGAAFYFTLAAPPAGTGEP
jgi:PAS domain S-box-containing protein